MVRNRLHQGCGSIYPPDAPIYTADNVTYTLTGNITSDKHGIVIERDNVILDGSGYTVKSVKPRWAFSGVRLSSIAGVTVKNVRIELFWSGIFLVDSSNNSISGNSVTNNEYGIYLWWSSNNVIYHNNFVNNTRQVYSYVSINAWDDGYPSGGNYWSNYKGVDEYRGPHQNQSGSDGIGDTPYVIDELNRDRYPLMNPVWDVAVTDIELWKTVVRQGFPTEINVTVMNQGRYAETFNVSIYVNEVVIMTQTLTLDSWTSTTLTFTWYMPGFGYRNYVISAYATPVLREIDVTDNKFVDGIVVVTIPGDVDGNFVVNIYDVVMICIAYGSKRCEPLYHENPNCDGVIDIHDVVIACANYGRKYP